MRMISFPTGISKKPNCPTQPFITAVDSQPAHSCQRASSWDSCPVCTAVAPWHHHLFHFNDAGYLENDDVILRRTKWAWAAINDLVPRPVVSWRYYWSLDAVQLSHIVALQCKDSFGVVSHSGHFHFDLNSPGELFWLGHDEPIKTLIIIKGKCCYWVKIWSKLSSHAKGLFLEFPSISE